MASLRNIIGTLIAVALSAMALKSWYPVLKIHFENKKTVADQIAKIGPAARDRIRPNFDAHKISHPSYTS